MSIVFTDADTGAPVGLDYTSATTNAADAHGNISRVELSIPAGTSLPTRVRAYVVADVYPLIARVL